MLYNLFPDIDYSTLTEELSYGIRLPTPTFCPDDIAQIIISCWQEDPNSRPSFSQLTSSLYQTSVMQNIFQHNKNENGNYSISEENRTIYTNVLSNGTMYNQYKTIQESNSSYMKMELQTITNNEEIHNLEEENSLILPDQTENEDVVFLTQTNTTRQKSDYVSVRSPRRTDSTDDTDSGLSTDQNTTVTSIEENEITISSYAGRCIGRLQSLNEVEDEILYVKMGVGDIT